MDGLLLLVVLWVAITVAFYYLFGRRFAMLFCSSSLTDGREDPPAHSELPVTPLSNLSKVDPGDGAQLLERRDEAYVGDGPQTPRGPEDVFPLPEAPVEPSADLSLVRVGDERTVRIRRRFAFQGKTPDTRRAGGLAATSRGRASSPLRT